MELVPPLLLLLLLLYTSASWKSHVHRRGILELAGTTSCTTKRSPLAYLSYGCYCGLGGRGWPQDQTDWCCHKHDCCYGKAEDAGCYPKIERYKWECKDHKVQCGANQSKCQNMMCECDKEIAHCFARAEYNGMYIFFSASFCGKDQPKCD